MSFCIYPRVPAEDRASVALFGSFAQMIVKPRQYDVILVENMHQISASLLNASIPGICQPSVLRLGVKRDAACANPTNDFANGIIR
jgi:hypothetical protein